MTRSERVIASTVSAAAMLVATTAAGEPTGRWYSGWGQGTAETGFVSTQGNKVYIACDEGSGFGTSMAFEIQGRGPSAGQSVTLSTERDSWSFVADRTGRLSTASHVGHDLFNVVWGAIRRDQHLTIKFGDRSARIPLLGAAKVLEKDPCETDFAR